MGLLDKTRRMMSDEIDYKVGYKKPPKNTQFKKGRSGNPRGAGKNEARTMGDLIDQMLARKVRVTSNGKPLWVTMMQLNITQQVQALARGDTRALTALLRLKEH